jgi:transcriptional regulator with XRE-family HTH domain
VAKPIQTEYEEALLKAHGLHAGVYRRVADKLGVDASYVSRVATGERKASKIRGALLNELRRIQRLLS